MASTCGRPALFPFSSRRNCWQRWLPGLSFNAPCPLLFLLWLPLPQRNARGCVYMDLCLVWRFCVRVSLSLRMCVFLYFNVCVCVNVGSIAVAAVVGKCRCRSMLPSVLKTRKCVCKQQHLWLQQDLQSNLHSFHALSGLIDFS